MRKIAYLFTTFPKDSETFLQREIKVLAQNNELSLGLYSFFRGKGRSFAGCPLYHMGFKDWIKAVWGLLRMIFFCPGLTGQGLCRIMVNPPRSLTNAGEQVLGIGFALSHWSTFRQRPPDRFHAVWATGPATAALLLSKLTGIPFSMEAHAYDMYRRGGDCLLFSKMRKAEFIRTSTHAGATELVRRGADPGKVHLIRRGLVDFPPGRQKTSRQGPLRLLSVGRLVPKKGFHFLLDIASALAARDVDFHLRLIGDGPLWNSLQEKICKAGLSSNVSLSGKLPMEEVWRSHRWADFYLFTGQVAADGDRDGFPNVLGEAMASGAVILSTGVAGTSEGVQDRVTGRLLPFGTPEPWIEALLELKEDPEQQESFQTKARHWVQQNFDAHRNAGELGRLHRTFLTA